MRTRIGVLSIVGVVASLLLAGTCAAEGEGQPDLDKAIQTKISAQTFDELGTVIALCESALEKGLDKGNEEFCKQLLTSTLLQRAEAISERLFDGNNNLGQQAGVFWRLALKDVERAVEIDDKQPVAQLLLGKLMSIPDDGRKKARQALSKAIELAKDDNDVKAQALRWRAHVTQDLNAQLKDLDAAAKLAPEDAEILRDRGQVYLTVNRPEDALADFDAALKTDANNAETNLARGFALAILGRHADARDAFSRAAELAPHSPMPLLQRARIDAAMNDFDEAVEDASRALEIDPDNVDGLTLKAQALALGGKAEEALAEAERAVQMKPESDDVLRVWAFVIEKADKTAHTIEGLRKQVEANPDDAISWLELGLLYSAQKEVPKAIDAFSAAIKIDPQREFAYHVRADTYLNRGMRKQAMGDYRRALTLDENNSGVLNNLAWLLATAPEKDLRDGEQALKLATKAAEITGYKQAHILSTLASAYAEMGDFKKAREWSQKSIDIADDTLKDQLHKELASYEKEQPWREHQEEEK